MGSLKSAKTTDDLLKKNKNIKLTKWNLNTVQKSIINIFDNWSRFKNIDNFNDLGLNNISYVDELKQSLEHNLNSSWVKEGLEKLGLPWNTSGKMEMTKLLNFTKEYLDYAKRSRNTEEFLEKVLKKLKGITDKTTFERVAAEYGCRAEGDMGYVEFNNFLRKKWSNMHLTHLTPEEYAHFFYKVDTLRKGIRQNNYLVNKEITLYRGVQLNCVLSMLHEAHLISTSVYQEWLEKYYDALNLSENKEICEFVMPLINKKHPIICDLGFMSTSKDKKFADGWASVTFIIKVKPGTATAADITNLSGHPDQQEMLFLPGQKFKVLKATYKDVKKYGNDWYSFEIEMETTK